MTGQDLSEVFLHEAQVQADAQQVQVRWVHSDMRTIPFELEFDAVINIFTAFGYLEDEDEDQKVLQQVYKALKPGGLFLLETLQPFDLLTSKNDIVVTMLTSDGQRTEYSQSLRIYTLTELAHMLAMAGLRVKAYYGGWDHNPLTMDSFRLILLSQKADRKEPAASRCGLNPGG